MNNEPHSHSHELGDFSTDWRVIPISALAIVVGLIGTGMAWVLLRLIGIITNFTYFHRWGTALVSPSTNHLGIWAILVPVAGSVIVGFMARYGSERIRGHGIPEALESILINGSKVEPRLAFLKPLSSAIAIGTGGPFGAEGPIIVTGGAFGSMLAQFFRLTSVERKTLLVAGAAAGMSATFASPVAAVLLAVELLLFEWKPRSFIPVALASATAGAARRYLLGTGPIFPVKPHPLMIGAWGLIGCVICGILAGVLASVLTRAVYATEDLFRKLPIHWMWWPAIGGVVVGIGGLIFPQALGVGYDTIGLLVQGDVPRSTMIGILLVKSTIWVVALSSGTSGGVLAPLLMMGGALGGFEGIFLPHLGVAFWPLVGMGAILGGAMRVPLTGAIFALELTHDMNMLLPLLVATLVAHAFTVLVLKRSILTEKVARRGYHLTCEYSVDPMEVLSAGEAMRTNLVAFHAGQTLEQVRSILSANHSPRGQHLYPVVDESRRLLGVITRNDLRTWMEQTHPAGETLGEMVKEPVVAHPDEPLRAVVYRMAETGLTRFPVVERGSEKKLLGMIALRDLLSARTRNLAQERDRERVLKIRLPVLGRKSDVNSPIA
jgi:chloride channel protein, CIC family